LDSLVILPALEQVNLDSILTDDTIIIAKHFGTEGTMNLFHFIKNIKSLLNLNFKIHLNVSN